MRGFGVGADAGAGHYRQTIATVAEPQVGDHGMQRRTVLGEFVVANAVTQRIVQTEQISFQSAEQRQRVRLRGNQVILVATPCCAHHRDSRCPCTCPFGQGKDDARGHQCHTVHACGPLGSSVHFRQIFDAVCHTAVVDPGAGCVAP